MAKAELLADTELTEAHRSITNIAVCFCRCHRPADAGEVELAQNAAVLVMSPSLTAPW